MHKLKVILLISILSRKETNLSPISLANKEVKMMRYIINVSLIKQNNYSESDPEKEERFVVNYILTNSFICLFLLVYVNLESVKLCLNMGRRE
jgi:hypothetical protein